MSKFLNDLKSEKQIGFRDWFENKISNPNFEIDVINIKNLSEDDFAYIFENTNDIELIPSREGFFSKVVNENNEHDWGKNLDYFPLHIDGGYYKKIPKYVILYCINNSKKGGETFFVESKKIVTFLEKKYDHDLLYSLNSVYLSPDKKIYTKPLILKLPNNKVQLNFFSSMYITVDHTTISNINRRIVTYTLSEILTDLLSCLKTSISYTHNWKPGDLVLFNNKTLLHGRNKIIDPSNKRLLYRIWLDNKGFNIVK